MIHYSPRYTDRELDLLLKQAKEVYSSAELTRDRMHFEIPYENWMMNSFENQVRTDSFTKVYASKKGISIKDYIVNTLTEDMDKTEEK